MESIEIVKQKRIRDGPMDLYETRCFEGAVFTPEETNSEDKPEEPEAKQEAEPEAKPETKPEAQEAAEEPDSEDVTEDTCSEIKEDSLKDFYKRYVGRTAAQCLLESTAPQRSLVWLEARKYCITASNFGAAVGHNAYMSPEQLVGDKIWSCFKGNAYTAFGTFHESDASRSLQKLLDTDLYDTLNKLWTPKGQWKWRLHEVGLLKWHKKPWMAVSPDGLLELYDSEGQSVWILVEYKCPARQRDSDSHPYARYNNNVPEYYMDQMQGVMGLLNEDPSLMPSSTTSGAINGPKHALFVVWQKHQVHVTLVPFESKYYTTSLEPALRSWYFTKYLPRAYLKHTGSLVYGTLLAGSDISVPDK